MSEKSSNPAINFLMSALTYEEEESQRCGYIGPETKFYIEISGYNSSVQTGQIPVTEQDILDWAKAIEEKNTPQWYKDPGLWVSKQPSVLAKVKECSQSTTGSRIATKISVIKEVRALRPELSLHEAKDAVEDAMARGLLGF